nr:MAG TPA: hypothetical protein [Bacteriophage sp.]
MPLCTYIGISIFCIYIYYQYMVFLIKSFTL